MDKDLEDRTLDDDGIFAVYEGTPDEIIEQMGKDGWWDEDIAYLKKLEEENE